MTNTELIAELRGHILSVPLTLLHDAADALEAAEQRIAELEKQIPKWISVEDGLPEESGSYLVCDVPYKIISVVAYSARWKRFNCYDTFTEEYVNEHEVYEVTHWMPLPDEPGVEG